jgi:hypothetical protein
MLSRDTRREVVLLKGVNSTGREVRGRKQILKKGGEAEERELVMGSGFYSVLVELNV